MGVRSVRVKEYTCDNPICGAVQVGAFSDDTVLGLKGSVKEYADYGGQRGTWFACSRACVGPAVAAVCDQVREGN